MKTAATSTKPPSSKKACKQLDDICRLAPDLGRILVRALNGIHRNIKATMKAEGGAR